MLYEIFFIKEWMTKGFVEFRAYLLKNGDVPGEALVRRLEVMTDKLIAAHLSLEEEEAARKLNGGNDE